MGGNSYSKDHWKPDSQYVACIKCKKAFTMTNRRHHCRSCGGVFCSECCRRKAAVPLRQIDKEVRVCDGCYFNLLQSHGNGAGGPSNSFQNQPGGGPNSGAVGSFNNSTANGGILGSFNRGTGQGSPHGLGLNGSNLDGNNGGGGVMSMGAGGNPGLLAVDVALPQRPSGNPAENAQAAGSNNAASAADQPPQRLTATARANKIVQSVQYLDCPTAPDPMDPSYYSIEVDDFPNQLNLAAEEEDDTFSPPFPEGLSPEELHEEVTTSGQNGVEGEDEGQQDPLLSLLSARHTEATAFRDIKLVVALNDTVHDLLEHGIPAQLQEAGGRHLVEDYNPSIPAN